MPISEQTGIFLPIAGGTMQGQINMSGNTITNMAALPVMPNGAAPAQWVLNQIAAQSLYQGTWVPDTNVPDLTQPATHQNGFTWIATTSTTGGVVIGPAIPGLQGQTVFNGDTIIYSAIAGEFQLIHGGGLSLDEANALFLPLAGGQLSGPLLLNANASQPMQAVTLSQLQAFVPPGAVGEAPNDGQLYGRNGLTTSWAPVLPLAGGILTGSLTLFGNATSALQAVPYQQLTNTVNSAVASYLPLAGGTLSGPLVLSGNAANNTQAVPLGQVSGMLAGYMPISGGTFTGAVTMPAATMTGVLTLAANAASALQAVPLQQLNSSLAGYLPLTGGSLTGNLNSTGTISGNVVNANSGTIQTLNAANAAVTGTIAAGQVNGTDATVTSTLDVSNITLHGTATGGAFTGQINATGNGIVYPPFNPTAVAVIWNTGLYAFINGSNQGRIQFVASDASLKENLSPISVDCLSVLDKVPLQQFDWIPTEVQPNRLHWNCGFTAQDIQALVPESVPPTPPGYPLGVDLLPLIGYLIGAIQQISVRVGALDGKAA